MADDLPEAEATGPLKITRPSSPQKTNSNTHNAVEDGAMAHTGSVKRVRSLDGDEQEPTTNSASSPKRARLNEDDQTPNCKEPNVNNKDHADEAASNDSDTSEKGHINSNGALDGTKSRDSPVDVSKDSSKAPSIDGASDADVSSQGESEVVDKDENSQNSTTMDSSKPKNGAPSEHSKEADSASKEANDASLDEDKQVSESSVNSTLTESNSERTASLGRSGDKLCDSNAKENDKDFPKKDGKDDKDGEEKMEVDGEYAKDEKDSAKPTNGVDSIDKEETHGSSFKKDEDVLKKSADGVSSQNDEDLSKKEADGVSSPKDEDVSKKEEAKEDSTIKDDSKESTETRLKDGKKEAAGGDDIIVLSDDNNVAEPNQSDNSSRPLTPVPEPIDPLADLTDEQIKARDEVIKRLHEELRNEEAKLLLLKKLRQSQQQPVTTEPKEDPAAAAAAGDPVKLIGQNPNAVPPPLVHGPGSLKPQLSNQATELARQQRLMPQLIRGGNLQQGQGLHGNIQSGPPPLVLARGGNSNLSNLHAQQQHQRNQMMRMITTSNITHTTSSTQNAVQHGRVSSASNSAQETQSAASRQAAAKLALRKQLEKTLLQIPPPKPPPPELHFLPSAANNEFIILVGLEEVVNTILDIEQKDKTKKEPKYIAPFRCAQCKTDFTTIWKQGSKQGIMCENCIVSNQKKALKAEHTNRLKTAFVKALQQEQEIEQRMQQSHSASASATSLNIPRVNKVRQVPLAHSHQSLQSGHHGGGVQVIQQLPRQRVLNPAPPQRTMQPVTFAYIPQGGVNIAGVSRSGIQMIPKQQFVSGHPAMVNSDRQREYLLDMISSKSGSSLSWKR